MRIEKDQLLAHDFPLRPNLLVRVVLPADLTMAEAERVIRFIDSIAFDRESLPSEVRPNAPSETG